jgi:large subunit ribosomal protein L4e
MSGPGPSGRPDRKVQVLDLEGRPGNELSLPDAFHGPVRIDLIRRAVVSAQSHRIQPHGTSLTAGARHSVQWSGKGKGVSRTPRLMGSMTGAQSPNTVGGRPAHPPKVDRIWAKKINIKERRLAFASALAATRAGDLASARGHHVPEGLSLPLIVETPLEEVLSASEARTILGRLKLVDEIERVKDGVSIRAGRGKRRGRRHHVPIGLLVVTSAPKKARGFRNLPGVDVVSVGRLGTEDLAPGGTPGRLTVFSQAALESLGQRLSGE